VGTGLVFVWGLALLVIAALLAVLVSTLRHGARAVPSAGTESDAFQPLEDRLLFQHEENSVRVSTDARVIVRVPGIAWDASWRRDLLRLEVVEQSPAAVSFPSELGDVEVLAVYDLAAFRMTEVGTDVPVERFLEPIDVILTTDLTDRDLGLVTRADSTWILTSAASALISPEELDGVTLVPGMGWAAVATTRLGRVCLVRLRGG
jgi:hypothetical protein